jgi:hypothetical protein
MDPKPDKLIPAVTGGIVIGVFSTIIVMNLMSYFYCIGILSGGFIAVFLFIRNLRRDAFMVYSDGALLGIFAGIIGVIFGVVMNTILGSENEFVFHGVFDHAGGFPPDLHELILRMKENPGVLLIVQITIGLVINVIFGLVGGVLAVVLLGRKK